ncbi:SEC-C metal-binding domain-containing protein [Brevundimonas sp.]|uniref:SEC-C metal-binding domain-containing protein n=1 Tax=Brevundimonas sp. TaxID=1871086 RepID=UPI0025C556BB|nr:SEC-C metal-binding domain-containing protein [Brevundimonas sp.]
MGKKSKAGRARNRPDESFAVGPFEFARKGRVVIGRNRMSPAQQTEATRRAAALYPGVVAEMQALVDAIAHRVAGLPPDRLLQRAFYGFFMAQVTGGEDADAGRNDGIDLRMIDYVQSVIAAVPPRLPYAADVSEEDFTALRADIAALFSKLSLDYPMTRTATRQLADPDLDMDLEGFQVKAELLWANVRGHRFQNHEREALQALLEPHSAVLQRLFGLDAAGLAQEAENIQSALTRGLHDAGVEALAFHKDCLKRMEEVIQAGAVGENDHPMAVVMAEPAFAARGRDVMGRFMGMDLFDVEKTSALPQVLRDALSWSPGEETDFFGPGEDKGWPLRVWPTMKRPFLRFDGRTYCFDRYALFDHLYRALQRIVIGLEPGYRTAWKDGQMAASENLPFEQLGRLLPGATRIQSIYYRWAPDGGPAQWHEADGILAYDGHLFIIEIKGGAFTWTSPTTDLPAHLASLRALVAKPAEQGSRFLDYLASQDEVPIFDAAHQEIGRLRLSDYRKVSLCAVTLDAFTALAARAQHLRAVGVDVGARPVWALSLDDLRVFTDLFANPLDFLHFTEQRMLAAASPDVDVDDELDHLGLYLRENHYSAYARSLAKRGGIPRFDGYTAPIYAFYAGLLRDEAPAPPHQDRPALFEDILAMIDQKAEPGRSELSSLLLDLSGQDRTDLADRVAQALIDQSVDRRSKPLSFHGEIALTVYVWSPSALRDAAAARQHTEQVAAAAGEDQRVLLELQFGPGGVLVNLHWSWIALNALSVERRAELRRTGEALVNRRLAAAEGGIGRNALCPCGSGSKYKICHGRRQAPRGF